MKPQPLPLMFVTVLISVNLLACSLLPQSIPVPSLPGAGAVNPAQTSQTTGTPNPVPQTFAFPDSAGLDRLDGYAQTFTISFKGTRNSQSVETSSIYTRTVSHEPAAQFTFIQSSNQDGKPINLLFGSIGDARYQRLADGAACTVELSKSANGDDDFDPASLLIPIPQDKELGQETVNGVPTHHYAVNSSSASGATTFTGEVWIADPGAFVVKYALQIRGNEEYFGAGNQGEQDLMYEVKDIGVKKTIAPPVGCPPAVSDLPVMADAAQLAQTPLGVSYTSASGLQKVYAFYLDRMKASGWTVTSGSGDLRQNYSMIFSLPKDQTLAFVQLTAEGTAVTVQAQVVPGQTSQSTTNAAQTNPASTSATPQTVAGAATPGTSGLTGTVTANAHVRAAPSTSGAILVGANKGGQVTAVGRTAASDWLQIVLPGNPNARGWISAALVQLQGSADTLPVVQPSAGTPTK